MTWRRRLAKMDPSMPSTTAPQAPALSPSPVPAADFVAVPLRPHFFQASAFFPMPIVLVATHAEGGLVNLAPYSLCFPHLSPDGYQMELVCRASSKTAANLKRTGRCSINFLSDKPDYLACCRTLAEEKPTAEKMKQSIFTFIGSAIEGAPPLVAESVQAFECKLSRAQPWGEADERFLLDVENVRMQRYWARVLEDGRTGPRLAVDYGFRKAASTWMSRPVMATRGPRLRPQYVIEVARPPDRVLADFAAALQRPDTGVWGKTRGNVLQINIPLEEQTTWSPSMELAVEPAPNGSVVYARIGPLPQVWITFIFIHLFIAMIGLSGFVWGISQLFMGGPTWALGVFAGALFLHAFVAGAAFVGQGLGADQIYRLRTFASDVLGQ
jgi:flavin reductase (DIM6/NTAB) family NADH-FMN oxidoreductase RutF